MAADLPCNGEGVCMVCGEKPSEGSTLTCRTCVTPWHATCLSAPLETLSDAVGWECPDCSTVPAPDADVAPRKDDVAVRNDDSVGIVAKVREIEADGTLTEKEKAKRRQELLAGGAGGSNDAGTGDKEGEDLLKMRCSFCMQLPERPVSTPCGHTFCLKCFQKWISQGKRTCANCRAGIPPSMASQPRINSRLAIAIRIAKMNKSNNGSNTTKTYHHVLNQNRPDKCYTTERAKKTGKANACSGKIFVTVPPDHFGPILEENDPERRQGVLVGETWEDRMECRQWGAHLPHVAGIAGQSDYGAQSVALSGGYEDDEDHGEWFLYTGSGGRDLSGNKRTNKLQSFDQKFTKSNEALRESCRKGYPVRVVRSFKEKRSSYAPVTGVRYDGIYRIEKCWRKPGVQGFKVCRYLFVRCDNAPAPWTSDEQGDRPRPLPSINELKDATDIFERKVTPSWDFDVHKSCWIWTKDPPASRKQIDENGKTSTNKRNKRAPTIQEKLLKEFSCLICRKVMDQPLTTPCAHNFCKACLEGAFAGKTFIRQTSCEGRRSLRARKNVMKCPSCTNDISDFLQNPQANREMMSMIESLQQQINEADIKETSEEVDAADEKSGSVSGEAQDDGDEILEDEQDDEEENNKNVENFHNVSSGIIPVETNKREKVSGKKLEKAGMQLDDDNEGSQDSLAKSTTAEVLTSKLEIGGMVVGEKSNEAIHDVQTKVHAKRKRSADLKEDSKVAVVEVEGKRKSRRHSADEC